MIWPKLDRFPKPRHSSSGLMVPHWKCLRAFKKKHCRGSTPEQEQQQQQQQQQQQHDSEDSKTCMARPLNVSANWSYMIKLLGETTPTAQFLIDKSKDQNVQRHEESTFSKPSARALGFTWSIFPLFFASIFTNLYRHPVFPVSAMNSSRAADTSALNKRIPHQNVASWLASFSILSGKNIPHI